MTIESLAESFREAKAKAGHPARIKYPKNLKDAAIEYFKANPKLIPSRKASMIGISTSCAEKVRQADYQLAQGFLQQRLDDSQNASSDQSCRRVEI